MNIVYRPTDSKYSSDRTHELSDCGNELDNNPVPIPNQGGCPDGPVIPQSAFTNCKGDPKENCGGSNIIGIYILH